MPRIETAGVDLLDGGKPAHLGHFKRPLRGHARCAIGATTLAGSSSDRLVIVVACPDDLILQHSKSRW